MASDTIQSVTIEGFKSIRSIKDLPLRPINLLIGANGSGKSNFLDAFVFIGEAFTDKNLDSYVAYYGGADKLLHFGSKTTHDILVSLRSLSGRDTFALYHYAANDSLVGTTSAIWLDGDLSSLNRFRFQDTGDDSPLKKTNDLHNNRSLFRLGGNLAAFLYRLQLQFPGSYAAISKTVQQVAPFFDDFQLAPLALNPETIKLEWRHKQSDQYFDASAFSDGTLRFIALATLFLQPVELRPSVILVDEPELGLHPFAIELLASLIRQASKDTQVIAATQSPLLLDYFDPEDVLVADRVNGATEIKRLQRAPLAEWLKDYSLGQLWEKGELAGRPEKEIAMSRLLVHVEGQTEEAFVSDVLREHLTRSGFSSVSARLVGNPRLRSRRGGIRSWESVRQDIVRHLKEDAGAVAATMVDYYALPLDWPGRAEAPGKNSTSEKAEHVEMALLNDIRRKMGSRFDSRRFVPLVMMHEFEALLFSDPERFAQGIGRSDLAPKLRIIRQEFESPEDINDSPETAPSKRIAQLYPGYEKPLLGPLAVMEIGLQTVRQECHHFNNWMVRLEALPEMLSSL